MSDFWLAKMQLGTNYELKTVMLVFSLSGSLLKKTSENEKHKITILRQ
jgi:hypothetical protein